MWMIKTMITDFNDIKDEKDRALYVNLRNVLDDFFISQVYIHKDKDHRFNECESLDVYKELKNMFLGELKRECRDTRLSEIEIIENWIHHNQNQMLMFMSSLIVLNEEYNKRKQ